ncbi:hypothetical protein [Pseudoponticoccus marisrubri]|uniref:Uncharacterized protein n=1 Tax=Pseudoponticoccus marisrubri TaxID=1685382 RepID=A0A0W7WP96_9RHOB|nr:hypothetical protein [Pseudoponticoccus marisrubri]KUF12418.1 hypothetical protein AVJ23_01430 [Pseudoponticoccus marisrubri]
MIIHRFAPRALLACGLLALPLSAAAQSEDSSDPVETCRAALSQDDSRDLATGIVFPDDIDGEPRDLDLALAAAQAFAAGEGCADGVALDQSRVSACTELDSVPAVCVLHTGVGYFLVHESWVDPLMVFWSRYD